MALFSIIVLLYNDAYSLGILYFYFILVFISYDIIASRSIRLISVWCFSFLFIILSEVFNSDSLQDKNFLNALKYLIIANNLVILGFYLKRKNEDFLNKNIVRNTLR